VTASWLVNVQVGVSYQDLARHFVGPRRFVGHRHFVRVAHFPNRRFVHVRRIHHRNAFFVAPVFGAYAYSSYDYGCYWLKRNAIYTGSGYWWNRYYACLYGY